MYRIFEIKENDYSFRLSIKCYRFIDLCFFFTISNRSKITSIFNQNQYFDSNRKEIKCMAEFSIGIRTKLIFRPMFNYTLKQTHLLEVNKNVLGEGKRF